jgi:hypothetical protein
MTAHIQPPAHDFPGGAGTKIGAYTSPCFSKLTVTRIPLCTELGSQPTTLDTMRNPGWSSSSTIAITNGVGTAGWNC